MDDPRVEYRHGQVYDPDDRTTRGRDVEINTFPETVINDIEKRRLIDRKIAGFVLGAYPREPEVEELLASKKFSHNEAAAAMEITYGDPLGNHVVESRPDNPAGSMGRVITFRYVTQGPIKGPPKAA